MLSEDERWQYRVVAAGHPKTPQSALQRLSVDVSYQVRSWVVRNEATPDSVLLSMIKDVDEGIASYARLRLNKPN